MSSLWPFFPLLVAAAAMLALAALLLVLDASRVANRLFAAVLGLRALTFIAGVARAVAPEELQGLFNALPPYLIIPLVPLVLYLISVHPRRRGWLGTHPAAPWILVAATTGILAWLTVEPSAYATTSTEAQGYALAAGPLGYYTDFGPLILFTALRLPVFGLAAVWFARDYVRTPPGSRRHSALLLFAGFGLNALYDGATALTALGSIGEGIIPWTWGWAFLFLPPLALLAGVVSIAILLRGQRGPYRSFHGVRRFLIAAAFAVFSGVALEVVTVLPGGDQMQILALGFWRLALPALVTYGLLRYSLFDMDLKVKRGLGKGTIVGSFLVILVATSEIIQNVVEQSEGPVFGVAAAAVMTLAFRPVEKLGVRVSDRMLPDVKPIRDQSPEERRRFYEEHYALALEDGRLTGKEKRLLSMLAERLDLEAKP